MLNRMLLKASCYFVMAAGLLGTACDTTVPDTTPVTPTLAGPQGSGSQSSGSTAATGATQLEQLALERINRARLKPAAEAALNGIAIDEGIPGQINATPKQAVALNAALIKSARGHSDDMIARDYFEHDTPEGVSPFTRMNQAGYLFVTAGENLAWRGSTGNIDLVQTVEQEHVDLFTDFVIPDRGHRVTMLNGTFREVGIGITHGVFTKNAQNYDSIMQTQDYGTAPSSPTFVLGVVYNDANSNGQYDAGEGTSGQTVILGGTSKTSNSAGGYSFAVNQAGTYTLRFTASKSVDVTINTGTPNIKVDFVSGSQIVVNLGVGVLN